MNWLFFALLAYGFWAGCNIIDKIILSKKQFKSIVGPAIFINFFFVLTFLLIPFIDLQVGDMFHLVLAIGSGVLLFFSIFPYYKAISLDDVSSVVPLWQLSPILILLISTFTIGEDLSYNQYLGFGVLLAAGFMISIKKTEGMFRFRKAVPYALISIVVGAVYSVLIKYLLNYYDHWSMVIWARVGIMSAFLILLIFFKKYRRLFVDTLKIAKKDSVIPLAFIVAVLGIGGTISMYYAISLNSISLVAVLGGFQPLFVLALASAFAFKFPKILKEELEKKVIIYKLIAMFLMFIGLFLVYK